MRCGRAWFCGGGRSLLSMRSIVEVGGRGAWGTLLVGGRSPRCHSAFLYGISDCASYHKLDEMLDSQGARALGVVKDPFLLIVGSHMRQLEPLETISRIATPLLLE
jgi:hypothetical protein